MDWGGGESEGTFSTVETYGVQVGVWVGERLTPLYVSRNVGKCERRTEKGEADGRDEKRGEENRTDGRAREGWREQVQGMENNCRTYRDSRSLRALSDVSFSGESSSQ